jgi:hypothetical protein
VVSDAAPAPTPATSDVVGSPEPARPRTRAQAGIRKPKVYTDGTVRYGCLAVTQEPANLDEALCNKDWKQAIDLEELKKKSYRFRISSSYKKQDVAFSSPQQK